MTWLLVVVRGPDDLWMVDVSVGLYQYAGSSVSPRGPQYGMTLSRRRLTVGFFQSWHGLRSLTFFF